MKQKEKKKRKTLFHFVRTEETLNTEGKKNYFKTSYDIGVDNLMNILFCKTCILCLLHEARAQNIRILDPAVL